MSIASAAPVRRAPPPAREPAEERGGGRDDVRLLVAHGDGHLEHARFDALPDLLAPGDLFVVNTSSTLPAALAARGPDGAAPTLHLSTPSEPTAAGDPGWVAELRRDGERYRGGRAGDVLALPAGGTAVLLEALPGARLWRVALCLPAPVLRYLAQHGEPIRYGHVSRRWPLERYQTVYATEPGSAEMPSAGRAFTPELITRLVALGIDVAPVLLHTGVSSLEAGERPQPEWYRVPRFTAERANLARSLGGRTIAVGTTVVRALESAAAADGRLAPAEGWTELVIEPDSRLRGVDALLSGFHDRDSSHLAILEAIAGRELLVRSYEEAARAGLLRHEFGDLHLLLPRRAAS